MNTVNQNPHTSQQKPQQTIKYFISSLLPQEMKVLQLLWWFRSKGLSIHCAQAYIGLKTGYARETINRLLRRFRDIGLINWTYRHRHTCVYFFSALFDDPEMKKF